VAGEGRARGDDRLAGRDLAVERLGQGELDFHLAAVIQRGDDRRFADAGAVVHLLEPDDPVERGAHLPVLEAPLRAIESGPGRSLLGNVLIERCLGDGIRLAQRAGAFERLFRLAQCRPGLGEIGAFDIVIEPDQDVVGGDRLPGLEQNFETRPLASETISIARRDMVDPTASTRRSARRRSAPASCTGTPDAPGGPPRRSSTAGPPLAMCSYAKNPPATSRRTKAAPRSCLNSDTIGLPNTPVRPPGSRFLPAYAAVRGPDRSGSATFRISTRQRASSACLY
jgi:hypothetical protein